MKVVESDSKERDTRNPKKTERRKIWLFDGRDGDGDEKKRREILSFLYLTITTNIPGSTLDAPAR